LVDRFLPLKSPDDKFYLLARVHISEGKIGSIIHPKNSHEEHHLGQKAQNWANLSEVKMENLLVLKAKDFTKTISS